MATQFVGHVVAQQIDALTNFTNSVLVGVYLGGTVTPHPGEPRTIPFRATQGISGSGSYVLAPLNEGGTQMVSVHLYRNGAFDDVEGTAGHIRALVHKYQWNSSTEVWNTIATEIMLVPLAFHGEAPAVADAWQNKKFSNDQWVPITSDLEGARIVGIMQPLSSSSGSTDVTVEIGELPNDAEDFDSAVDIDTQAPDTTDIWDAPSPTDWIAQIVVSADLDIDREPFPVASQSSFQNHVAEINADWYLGSPLKPFVDVVCIAFALWRTGLRVFDELRKT